MREELEIIQKDIKDLEARLNILKDRETKIKDKLNSENGQFIGKYFTISYDMWKGRIHYIHVKDVEKYGEELFAVGPCIVNETPCNIAETEKTHEYHELYSIKTNIRLLLTDNGYAEITKDDYMNELKKVIKLMD